MKKTKLRSRRRTALRRMLIVAAAYLVVTCVLGTGGSLSDADYPGERRTAWYRPDIHDCLGLGTGNPPDTDAVSVPI